MYHGRRASGRILQKVYIQGFAFYVQYNDVSVNGKNPYTTFYGV